MTMRQEHVDRMLERHEDLRSAARVSGAGSPAHAQAGAALSATVRNASPEELDAFTDASLDDVLGPGWRDGRQGR